MDITSGEFKNIKSVISHQNGGATTFQDNFDKDDIRNGVYPIEIYQKRRSYMTGILTCEQYHMFDIIDNKDGMRIHVYIPGETIIIDGKKLFNELLTTQDYLYKNGITECYSIEYMEDIVDDLNTKYIDEYRIVAYDLIWCRSDELDQVFDKTPPTSYWRCDIF